MAIGDRPAHRGPTGSPRSGGSSRRVAGAPKARIRRAKGAHLEPAASRQGDRRTRAAGRQSTTAGAAERQSRGGVFVLACLVSLAARASSTPHKPPRGFVRYRGVYRGGDTHLCTPLLVAHGANFGATIAAKKGAKRGL